MSYGAPNRRIEGKRGQQLGRFLSLGTEGGPRIVDQGGEDVTQQIALRDDRVGAVFDRSRVELVLGHQRRPELIEIAGDSPLAARPDLMHRSLAVPPTTHGYPWATPT